MKKVGGIIFSVIIIFIGYVISCFCFRSIIPPQYNIIVDIKPSPITVNNNKVKEKPADIVFALEKGRELTVSYSSGIQQRITEADIDSIILKTRKTLHKKKLDISIYVDEDVEYSKVKGIMLKLQDLGENKYYLRTNY